jgi:hypothetical protein
MRRHDLRSRAARERARPLQLLGQSGDLGGLGADPGVVENAREPALRRLDAEKGAGEVEEHAGDRHTLDRRIGPHVTGGASDERHFRRCLADERAVRR